MNRSFQITRAACLPSLVDFRNFIQEVCQGKPGIDQETISDLKLAVDEACSNIIQHGYAGMDPGTIIVGLQIETDQVVVTIIDFGLAFEPASVPKPDIAASEDYDEIGGFGLYFIYQSMDSISYVSDEAGNHLTLVKKIGVQNGKESVSSPS